VQEIVAQEFNDIFNLISKQWMLIACKNKVNNKINMMTASWGGFGVLWHKNVTFSFVRPQRYTYELLEKNNYYTLNFLPEKYREVLNFCGKNSGKNIDKIQVTKLTEIENGNYNYFQESELVICCKKLYSQLFKHENFHENKIIETWYPEKDFHKVYIGEIIKIFKKESFKK